MANQIAELTVEQLRQVCDPAQFQFHSTMELPPLSEVIGQDRAIRAITFGINIKKSGYHMYALGSAGTGKTTTIRRFLEHEASQQAVPDDWLYINNFADPDKPRTLRLPTGVGCRFQTDMEKLVNELSSEVSRAFESAEYSRQQEQVRDEFQQRNQALLQAVGDYAQSKGFVILQTPQGLMIAPVNKGNVVGPDELDKLDETTRKKVGEGEKEVQEKLRATMRDIQQLQREARQRNSDLDKQTVAFAVGHLIDELAERYTPFDAVMHLLNEIRADILENAQTFKQMKQLEQMASEQGPLSMMLGRPQVTFDQYRVNLLVKNCEGHGAPVVLARNPSYHNLIGRVEHQGQFGTLVTNFNMIKGGLLHKANGGYLIIDAREVLTKPLAWEGLIRALKNKQVEIESLAEAYGIFATRTLEPEPIPLDIKVVVIGDPQIYYLLFAYDPDFRELFKVKVDFSQRIERTSETTMQYAQFIAAVGREEQVRPFDPSGVARVVEQGARMVEHQGKLITKFGDIVDLIRQSSYWAEQNAHELVSAADVRQAIDEKIYRSDQIQQLLEEAFMDGTLLIDAAGMVTGQINGIAVLSLGDYAFGKPSRITARTHIGDKGVVSIDREVKLGGPIHNKGSLILAGYLGGRYATDTPLTLSASITFEQAYDEIEGDSASSVELYALLSSLSGFPIRQDLAVTGSVNQLGQVQAIGGVNEKIEGYFDVCKLIGLSGHQGVMIPHSNTKHLMLREDVVDAVRDGQFHIYPVATIDEGIALLTGKEAGERQPDGSYPEDTVNGAVYRNLLAMARKVKAFMKTEGQGGE